MYHMNCVRYTALCVLCIGLVDENESVLEAITKSGRNTIQISNLS